METDLRGLFSNFYAWCTTLEVKSLKHLNRMYFHKLPIS